MGNTVFYRQVEQDVSKIGWKDIFSDFRKKHTREDFEYALTAGTSLNTSSEELMLQRWRKPWVFYPLLKWGVGIIVLLYAVFFGLKYANIWIAPAIEYMVIVIPPLIPEIILMVFFWELNIPRNISLFELISAWIVGGLFSLVAASVLISIFPNDFPACISAPLMEEPAKLIASIIIIAFLSRKKKIYGITGFVIGAAVGAGFGAFESVQYAFGSAQAITEVMQDETGSVVAVVGTSMNTDVLYNHIIRILTAVGGHVLYCAPYSAELARHTKNNKVTIDSILNLDFILAFFISCFLHGLWDTDIPGGNIGMYLYCAFLIVLIGIEALRILRKCLNQVVQIGVKASGGAALEHGAGVGYTMAVSALAKKSEAEQSKVAVPQIQADQSHVSSGQSRAKSIRLICNEGELKGMQWESNGISPLFVGREGSCGIRFSSSARGVSGQHCSIQLTQFGWTVKDLGSSFGTFVSGGQKVLPGTEIKLHNGDIISLGGNENTLLVNIL
ncbi:MAG: PrsW family intramembrane metalloprotease [Lachnospiraceae bacterium]|nr:PrsW family intramembrane metalloprotease [Lachnospiraceae bacterium]